VTGYVVVHDVDGPKIRLGVVWFAVSVGACVAARSLLALVMAVAAALAADQLVRLHDPSVADAARTARERAERLLGEPVRLTAAIGAASLPLAAAAGSDTLAGAMAATVIVGLVAAGGRAVLPISAALSMGLAAASPVLLHRLGMSAGLFLLVLVAAYDAGDFLVGTDAGTTWEGPAAGVAAVAVVGFAATVLAPPPLLEDGAATLAILVALLGPLGPLVASLLVGDGGTKARFVRRLDSLIVVGPIAAYVIAALPR
jgi:hypothetical protein